MKMQEKMYGLIDFMLKDLQALPELDPALRSKSRATPKVPQARRKTNLQHAEGKKDWGRCILLPQGRVQLHPPHWKHRVWSQLHGSGPIQRILSLNPWSQQPARSLSHWSSYTKCYQSPPSLSLPASWPKSYKTMVANEQGVLLPRDTGKEGKDPNSCLGFGVFSQLGDFGILLWKESVLSFIL